MNGFTDELTGAILPFWIDNMQDAKCGGFYGRIDGQNMLHPDATKGVVMNARILWTFSAAYRLLGDPQYLEMAQRAFRYMTDHFIDHEYGGVYWEIDRQGKPVNAKKQTYAQGFALYGFSEYYRAVGDPQALELAVELFHLIEKYKDTEHGGYYEAFTRDWQPIEDMRLSAKDANEKKSMNTHLHILEPYTNLLRCWRDEKLIAAQRELIDIFTRKILDQSTCHLNLFFADDWQVRSKAVSYGHDIEASWLLYEAGTVLDDQDIIADITPLSCRIADAAMEGLLSDGSLAYESSDGHTDTERHWWVQAEAVVGCMYAFKNSGSLKYELAAQRLWDYIKNNLSDGGHGEWYWSRLGDGSINHTDDKAGFWKCPYHNGRMCMEMIENFGLK